MHFCIKVHLLLCNITILSQYFSGVLPNGGFWCILHNLSPKKKKKGLQKYGDIIVTIFAHYGTIIQRKRGFVGGQISISDSIWGEAGSMSSAAKTAGTVRTAVSRQSNSQAL